MNKADLAQAFLNRASIKGVFFVHDDYVRVIAGLHAGKNGNHIMLLDLDPEPRFLLEPDAGFDVEIAQSEIELAST